MPRSPHNNPSETIGRLLSEMQDWIIAYDTMSEAFAAAAPQAFASQPPRPIAEEYAAQQAYRRAMGKKTKHTREAMRRLRTRTEQPFVKLKPSDETNIVAQVGNSLEADIISQLAREADGVDMSNEPSEDEVEIAKHLVATNLQPPEKAVEFVMKYGIEAARQAIQDYLERSGQNNPQPPKAT